MDQIKLNALIGDFHSSLWRFHFMVPEEIARTFIDGDDRRVVCTMPDREKIHTALMPNKGRYFILLNNILVKKYGLTEGGHIEILLEKETARFGAPLPDELEAALGLDAIAMEAFLRLTPGKRRSLIYIVNKVKSPESRIKKALAIAEHLNEAGTDLDFKRLNELIKKYNRSEKHNQ